MSAGRNIAIRILYSSSSKVSLLEDLCVSHIFKEIDVFNSAYLFSKDPVLRRNIRFLRRVYSSTILKLLVMKGKLKDLYGQFVINKYIRRLDLFSFQSFSWEALVNRITDMGNELEEFIFCSYKESQLLSSADTVLSHLTNLKVLQIKRECTDTILCLISKYCLNLNELDINESSKVTGVGLRCLVNSYMGKTSLKMVGVENTRVDVKDVAFLLQNIPSLETVQYRKLLRALYFMHKKDLERGTLNTARAYNLTRVNYSGEVSVLFPPMIIDLLKICSAVCPRLKELYFFLQHQEHLDLCFNFSQPESVTLGCPFKDEIINVNSYFQNRRLNLTYLSLNCLSVCISVVAENCPQLATLQLTNVIYQTLDSSSKFCFKSLGKLMFHQQEFEENSVASLKAMLLSCPSLEEMGFNDCNLMLVDIGVMLFSKLKLRTIHFSNTSVKVSLLANVLTALTTLEIISVGNCTGINVEDRNYLCDIYKNRRKKPLFIFRKANVIIVSSDGDIDMDSDSDVYVNHGMDYDSEN